MSDFDNIKATITGLINNLQAAQELNRLALAGERLILSRTRRGEFLPGSSPGAQSYSEGHRRKRQAAGLPTSIVNLQFDDLEGMLSKVDHVIAADLESVAIDIANPRKKEIAGFHHISGAGKSRVIRKFFDFSEKEAADLVDLVGRDIEDLLVDLTRGN